MTDIPLEPTAVYPAQSSGAAALRPRSGGAPAVPGPLVSTIGAIPGLSPRRTRRRPGTSGTTGGSAGGGEVPGADVDLVDALAGTEPWAWRAATGWLQDSPAVTTRQSRLAALAAFLRWLQAAHAGTGLLQVTEDHLVAYRDAAATGTLSAGVRTPGRPLAAGTVATRLANLSSFYRYARRRHVVDDNPVAWVRYPAVSSEGSTRALTPDEQLALRRGVDALAADHPVQAAAVGLLAALGVRVSSLLSLTAGDLRRVPDPGGQGQHTVLTFRRKGGAIDHLPLPARVLALLAPLRAGRGPGERLFTMDGGAPVDRWWVTAALRRAARAGGISPGRAGELHPHMLRATFITRLLRDRTAALEEVQAAVGHASPATTARYKDRADTLNGHPVYLLEDTYTSQPVSEADADA